MTPYENSSLVLTAVYDLLTFGLLTFVAYEALIKPKLANLAIYFQAKPKDTKQWSWTRQTMDFVIENRGPELRNIRVHSKPDSIGWANLGNDVAIAPKPTSEYFKSPIPYLASGEKYTFLWCDLEANTDILKKPFEITVEYDNPAFFFPRRKSKTIKLNFSAFDGTIFGVNDKYDVHNVAQELTRIREILEKIDDRSKKQSEKQASSKESL